MTSPRSSRPLAPRRRRSRLGRVPAIVAILVLLYAAICALAYFAQEKMLFPAPPALDESLLPQGAERLALTAADGVKLAGIRLPGRPGAPLILAFGGNGWNADAAALTLRDIYPEAEIVAFHYRGYSPSGGRPSTRAIAADSLLGYDAAVRAAGGRPVIAVGFSIGSGFAAHVAARRPVRGLILVTPFDSLTKVAAAQMPFLPVRALFRNPLEPAAELAGSRVPTAIVAAGEDRLVRPERTAALRRAVPRLVFDRTVAGAGHNDIYRRPEFAPAMRRALGAVLDSNP
jgi:pimeloyl-ACP methyl ester carboxylesterase